jgi:hypothetical protein
MMNLNYLLPLENLYESPAPFFLGRYLYDPETAIVYSNAKSRTRPQALKAVNGCYRVISTMALGMTISVADVRPRIYARHGGNHVENRDALAASPCEQVKEQEFNWVIKMWSKDDEIDTEEYNDLTTSQVQQLIEKCAKELIAEDCHEVSVVAFRQLMIAKQQSTIIVQTV